MATKKPVIALVGGTGLVGSALARDFSAAFVNGQLEELRLLTSDSSSPKFEQYKKQGARVVQVDYEDASNVRSALEGADVLVSAMGTKGNYKQSKKALVEAAAESGVKIYVPSEFGTDHNDPKTKGISDMFVDKQAHHKKAEDLGLKVLAFYTGLLSDISFSSWLNLDSSIPNPTWKIPKPSRPLAFTSLNDIGSFVLFAVLQVWEGATDIPSRLRVYSDCLTIEECAIEFEVATGAKVTRVDLNEEDLAKEWEKAKPTIPQGMLGPAIPLMIAQGVFDHSKNNSNALLIRKLPGFEPTTIRKLFATRPKFN